MAELKPCPFCHEDLDGYTRFLPRKGVGNIFIHRAAIDGWQLNFSGKYRSKAEVKINFCPMCGRDLEQR